MKKKLFSGIPELSGRRLCMKRLTQDHAQDLRELAGSEAVYRYLPTFLFERRYADAPYVIRRLYDECWKE
jgi:ribosomal-protein-alanine N-acetyltransferase